MRRKGTVLQHGSLPLCGDITRVMDYLIIPSEERRAYLRDDLRRRATTLEAVLGQAVPFDKVATALVEGVSNSLNLDLVPGHLSSYERELADALYRDKYSTDEWNLQR